MNPASRAVIDVDVHAHLAPFNGHEVPAIPGIASDGEALVVDGHRLGILDLYRPERLIAWMDEQGIARALISIPPPLYRQQLNEADSRAWARRVNEGLLAIADASNGRLETLFHLPMEHPALAHSLLSELASSPFAGVALSAGGSPAIDYADPRHDDLWAELEARGAFVFLHPGACCDGRLAPFYLENLLGNPYETGVAASQLVMAGVPGRYPNIRFCLAHAGGVFPAIVGRLERGFATKRPGLPSEVERPLAAARRFKADCIAHHPGALKLATEVFGEGNLLFGSDWPFPMGLRDIS